MAIPPKKKKHYDFDTKFQVIIAKEKGMPNKEIQQKFQIVAVQQIYRWVKWFKEKKFFHLQQKLGHSYTYKKNYFLWQQKEAKLKAVKKIVQQEVQKQIKYHNQIISKEIYFQIIDKYRKEVPLKPLIKFLGLCRTSYYNWLVKKTRPKTSFLTNLEINIQKICFQKRYHNNIGKSFFIWGYRRVYQELVNQNVKVNPKTVYLKMKKFNLLCQTRKNRYLKRNHNRNYIPLSQLNLLKNNFQATRPFQKLCADFTYLPYSQNKTLYLSVIMDLYNREIMNYHLSDKRDAYLVLTPLNQLPTLKKPGLFHSDQGGEYIGQIIQTTLQAKNLIPSFSETGSPSQNACVEAFFANFKCETVYLDKRQHLTKERLTQIVHAFIENYNTQRRMKYLNYLSPYQFKIQKEHPQTTLRS